MTADPDLARWSEANDSYIAAAIEWLRLLLARNATLPQPPQIITLEPPRNAPSSEPQPVVTPQQTPWWKFTWSAEPQPAAAPASPAPPPKAPLALPPATFEVSQEQVDEAAAKMRAASQIDPPPALVLLAQRLGLSSFEQNVLLLCAAMEIDTRIPELCARVQGDPSLAFPTFGLALAIFRRDATDAEQTHWDARSPERPLRYWRLIEVNQPWSHPLSASALRADERIVNYIKGLSHLDDRVAPFVSALSDSATRNFDLPPSQQAVADAIVGALHLDAPHLRPIQLLGRDNDSKQVVARAAAQHLGLAVYRLGADALPTQAADIETLSRLWQRETLLLPLALYLDAHDVDRTSEHQATPVKRFLARSAGVLFVDAKEAWDVPQGSHSFDVGKPDPQEQRTLWEAVLGGGHEDDAGRLAAQFNLSAIAISDIATAAQADDSSQPLIDRLWSQAAHRTRMQIDALAQRVDAKATWSDLILPASELDLLHQITAQVTGRGTVYDDWGFRDRMNRGFGISALFVGESGTGKTMAAEVIANELKVPLYRIDLSSVVSKWVGETEKNLQQLFNAADDSNGILFFDEADALFGKRTEVQHSQDRFANMEVNFLLQRLESYRGLAILATNMKSALDPAFLRRLRFIVTFPFPSAADRAAIWKGVFPAKTPVKELDADRLARLPLAGGSVHNVALSAAFLANQRGVDVTMPIVLEAAKTEMRKLGKPLNDADFKWTAADESNVVEMRRP